MDIAAASSSSSSWPPLLLLRLRHSINPSSFSSPLSPPLPPAPLRFPLSFRLHSSTHESSSSSPSSSSSSDETKKKKKKVLSDQSSWESPDSLGHDYLFRLGAEADNVNVTVGARHGLVDDLFVGNFLGKDSDIVFDYRQKATRSFEYLQGDYYIAPLFLDKVGKLLNTKTKLSYHSLLTNCTP